MISIITIIWTLITYSMGENDTCSEIQSLEQIVNIIEKQCCDKVEDDTIPSEPIVHKETLPSRTIHNFMMQLQKKVLDAIRKVRDELQLDINYNKN